MSSSNATHVRLLNASLDSEGVYACEISTENLSTIRHQREIKVYVLPHSKLSIIGLRNSYALNDHVELQCQADASRPQGALAWFINGQRISAHSRHFELLATSSRSSQSNGSSLKRTSLALKFKLVAQLLQPRAWDRQQASASRNGADGNQAERRNQSRASSSQNDSSQVQLALLRLECKFKLTDVSDVTFNELQLGPTSVPGGAPAEVERYHKQARRERRRRNAVMAAAAAARPERLSLFKSHGGQIAQSSCPATRAQLLGALGSRARPQADCLHELGLLHWADPIIIEPEARARARGQNETETEIEDAGTGDNHEEGADERAAQSDGELLKLNCSTLGAFFSVAGSWADAGEPEAHRTANEWPLGPSRQPAYRSHDSAAPGPVRSDYRPPISYCADPVAHRRALISGKHQPVAGQPATVTANNERFGGDNNARSARAHQVAYLVLSGDDKLHMADHGSWTAGATTLRTIGLSAMSAAPMSGDNYAPESAQTDTDPMALTKSLAQLDSQRKRQQWLEQSLAPPLLEWFINNQEAPKSSASYAPELPLVSSSVESLDNSPPGGAANKASVSFESSMLPSIDYAEYFANFIGRPLEQHLELNLRLDKKLFQTPDSMLTLRCASTQAQVLASETASVSFLLSSDGSQRAAPPTTRQQQHMAGWRQRPAQSSVSQQQIKKKYLHQYPRSSSQKFASPPGARQRQTQASDQFVSSSSWSLWAHSETSLAGRYPSLFKMAWPAISWTLLLMALGGD